jgi:8-amino-7-oxononanoate synthase
MSQLRRGGIVSFVSPSYLGLERHPAVMEAVTDAVRRFGVTTATPRALLRDPVTRALENALARYVRRPAALVFPSARHAAFDVLPALAGSKGAVFVDERAYPTSVHGEREARRRGARVSMFAHNDVDALLFQLRRSPGPNVIVVDGVYVAGGDVAPLEAYARAAEQHAGLVYMDDSHGLGVLGSRRPTASGRAPGEAETPYGAGGGGLFRYVAPPGRRVVVAGTLTKAFGSPLAFVAAERPIIDWIADRSEAFTHDSPPSIANMAAALAALHVERRIGDRLRARLALRVAQFRNGVRALNAGGTAPFALASDGLFPIQTLRVVGAPGAFARGLARAGIVAAPQVNPPDVRRGAVLRFFLTARHSPGDIERAVRALAAFTHAWRRSAAVTSSAGPRLPPAASGRSQPARPVTRRCISRTAAADAS